MPAHWHVDLLGEPFGRETDGLASDRDGADDAAEHRDVAGARRVEGRQNGAEVVRDLEPILRHCFGELREKR